MSTEGKFSAAFYEALDDNKEIRAAFEFGQASIDHKEFNSQGVYQFFTLRNNREKYFLFET